MRSFATTGGQSMSRGNRRTRLTAAATVLGLAVGIGQASPSAARAVEGRTATAVAPATENVTRDDIQYADDESQPRRNGWFWLRYDQRGPGAQAEIARDLSPEAHGDGSLHLVTRTTDDAVAVRRLTAAPGDPRLPLADIASGSFDVLLSSGAAPSFVIGEGVVSRATESTLRGQGVTTVRIGGTDRAVTLPAGNEIVGANRYETATLVADRFFPEPATAAFASGATYPDALSAAAFGGHAGAPC